jgi:acyl carrier protein
MSDTEQRLRQCFSLVFPALSPEEVTSARPGHTEAWDSLASLTLLRVIEEEFGVQIDPFDFAEIASFDHILTHLTKQ